MSAANPSSWVVPIQRTAISEMYIKPWITGHWYVGTLTPAAAGESQLLNVVIIAIAEDALTWNHPKVVGNKQLNKTSHSSLDPYPFCTVSRAIPDWAGLNSSYKTYSSSPFPPPTQRRKMHLQENSINTHWTGCPQHRRWLSVVAAAAAGCRESWRC